MFQPASDFWLCLVLNRCWPYWVCNGEVHIAHKHVKQRCCTPFCGWGKTSCLDYVKPGSVRDGCWLISRYLIIWDRLLEWTGKGPVVDLKVLWHHAYWMLSGTINSLFVQERYWPDSNHRVVLDPCFSTLVLGAPPTLHILCLPNQTQMI